MLCQPNRMRFLVFWVLSEYSSTNFYVQKLHTKTIETLLWYAQPQHIYYEIIMIRNKSYVLLENENEKKMGKKKEKRKIQSQNIIIRVNKWIKFRNKERVWFHVAATFRAAAFSQTVRRERQRSSATRRASGASLFTNHRQITCTNAPAAMLQHRAWRNSRWISMNLLKLLRNRATRLV